MHATTSFRLRERRGEVVDEPGDPWLMDHEEEMSRLEKFWRDGNEA